MIRGKKIKIRLLLCNLKFHMSTTIRHNVHLFIPKNKTNETVA